MRRGVVVRVGVALAAVLHQEAGIVPGHADDAVRLMQQNVGQHAPVAVHHDHLSIGGAKQHLERKSKETETSLRYKYRTTRGKIEQRNPKEIERRKKLWKISKLTESLVTYNLS